MAIGTALSGITFREIGFYGVYTVCTALNIFGLLYGLVFIKEVPSVKSEIAKRKIRGPCSGFFNFEHVVEAFKVTFKDGPHNRKLRIIMILCIAFLIMGPLNGLWEQYCIFAIIGIRTSIVLLAVLGPDNSKTKLKILSRNRELRRKGFETKTLF